MKIRLHSMAGSASGLLGGQMEIVALEPGRRALVRLGKARAQIDVQTASAYDAGTICSGYVKMVQTVDKKYTKTNHLVSRTVPYGFCVCFTISDNGERGGVTIRERHGNGELLVLYIGGGRRREHANCCRMQAATPHKKQADDGADG